MWPAPLSVPKVLFFVLRYYLIGHLGFVLACEYSLQQASLDFTYSFAVDFPLGLSPEDCKVAFTRNIVSSALCVVVSECKVPSIYTSSLKADIPPPGILFIRVWAFSGRDRRMLAFLIFQAIVRAPGLCFTDLSLMH
jgi:hypothetical protein